MAATVARRGRGRKSPRPWRAVTAGLRRWNSASLPRRCPAMDMHTETAAALANADPGEAARVAHLRYVSDAKPGITRRRAGSGFAYRDPDGSVIRDRETRRRIRALAIPP